MIWDSVSTEHGPAMVTNSSPPTAKSSTGTIVRRRRASSKTSGVSANLSCQLSRTLSAPSGLQFSGKRQCTAVIEKWPPSKGGRARAGRGAYCPIPSPCKPLLLMDLAHTARIRPAPLAAGDSQTPRPQRPRCPTRSHPRRAARQSARQSATPRATGLREPPPPGKRAH